MSVKILVSVFLHFLLHFRSGKEAFLSTVVVSGHRGLNWTDTHHHCHLTFVPYWEKKSPIQR